MGRRTILGWLLFLGGCWAALTVQQLSVWQSDRAVWARAVELSPTNPQALTNLGKTYAEAQDEDTALALYRRAVAGAQDRRRPAVARDYAERLALINQVYALGRQEKAKAYSVLHHAQLRWADDLQVRMVWQWLQEL